MWPVSPFEPVPAAPPCPAAPPAHANRAIYGLDQAGSWAGLQRQHVGAHRQCTLLSHAGWQRREHAHPAAGGLSHFTQQAANLEFRSLAGAPPGPAPATPGDPAVPLVPFPGQGGGARKEWFGQVGQAAGCGLEERRGIAAAQPKMSLPALTDQSRLAKDQAPREQ